MFFVPKDLKRFSLCKKTGLQLVRLNDAIQHVPIILYETSGKKQECISN